MGVKILFFKKIIIFNTSHGQDIRSRDFINIKKKIFKISLGDFFIRKISNSINMILPSHYLADLGLKKIRKRFPKFWCVVGKTI